MQVIIMVMQQWLAGRSIGSYTILLLPAEAPSKPQTKAEVHVTTADSGCPQPLSKCPCACRCLLGA